ncbi:MAG: HDOD domain-containing protein [Syntrophales bacterium]|nr:HDOD domain-containing protein [Syntrophales bacterium]
MLEKILLSIKKLPPYPAVANKVAIMLSDEDFSVHEVVELVKYDQAIAANILKISNSAYFGTHQKITSLKDAIIFLGQKNLLRAIQTASAASIYSKSKGGYGVKAKDLWKHAVAVAIASQVISRRIQGKEDESLYTAALLHDVGKLVIGQYIQDAAAKIFDYIKKNKCSFLTAEEDVIGINHAEVGARIAIYWNFHPDLHDAIAYHHRPEKAKKANSKLPAFVHLADQICLLMGIDGGMDGLAHQNEESIIRAWNFTGEDLEKCMLQIAEELTKAQELFEVL